MGTAAMVRRGAAGLEMTKFATRSGARARSSAPRGPVVGQDAAGAGTRWLDGGAWDGLRVLFSSPRLEWTLSTAGDPSRSPGHPGARGTTSCRDNDIR